MKTDKFKGGLGLRKRQRTYDGCHFVVFILFEVFYVRFFDRNSIGGDRGRRVLAGCENLVFVGAPMKERMKRQYAPAEKT